MLESWRDEVLDELSDPHADLPIKTVRIDVARFGHATAIPVPGMQRVQSGSLRRLHFAHSDLSGKP